MTALPLADTDPQEPFGLTEIGQIALTVSDLERATAFYRDALGIRHLFSAPPGMAFFDCGGVRLLLGTEESSDHGRHSSVLYFRVEDIEGAHRDLAERGVVFEQEPHVAHRAEDHELWLAFFRDSEGNLHALMSEVKSA